MARKKNNTFLYLGVAAAALGGLYLFRRPSTPTPPPTVINQPGKSTLEVIVDGLLGAGEIISDTTSNNRNAGTLPTVPANQNITFTTI